MLYTTRPDNFIPKFEVSGIFVEVRGEILLLYRNRNSPQGNTWSVPAGKIDGNEGPLETIIREVKEETGIDISERRIEILDKVFIKYPRDDFVYHMFRVEFAEKPRIRLNGENTDYKWTTPRKALNLRLIPDEDACIKLVYGSKISQIDSE